MNSRAARNLRKLAGWHVGSDKKRAIVRGQVITKDPSFRDYKLLKKAYRVKG